MTSPSFSDFELLSAYLDGQIAGSEKTRLEIRLRSDPDLAAALEELRHTRLLLRRVPQRRAPRNFTLTPRMAGIRPPMPRLVPVFSWASAAAMLLFIFTLGAGMLSNLSLAAANAAPAGAYGMGGGPAAAVPAAPLATPMPATAAPALLAPQAETQTTAADQFILLTPTAQAFVMTAPQATQPNDARTVPPQPAPKARPEQPNPWLFIWPGLAVLLGILALLISLLNKRAFDKKNPHK